MYMHDAQELTQEEQILHHYAALIKRDLDCYQASTSRDERAWRRRFQISFISKTTTSLAFEFHLFVAFDFIMQLLLLLYKLTGLLLFTLTSFTLTLYFWDFWDFRQPKI